MIIKNKNTWIITGVLLLAILIVFNLFGKSDDWTYSHTSGMQWLIYGGIGLGVCLLAWLVTSIVMIVKGKPNEYGKNPMRFFGIVLLATPFIIIGGTMLIFFISMMLNIGFLLLLVPVLLLAYVIWLIIKAKNIGFRWYMTVPAVIFLLIILIIPFAGIAYFGVLNPSRFLPEAAQMSKSADLGFSVGGAKDINNFRQNIARDYLPLPTDITYEGLYYDYFFDTGQSEQCEKLFCPSYSYALSKDPISNEEEHYLQVGLNSNIKESDFERKNLNLVIVLDISGSMSSSFTRYYYDDMGKPVQERGDDSKMKVARESIVNLLDHLTEKDRFGMVLFDNKDYLAKPLSLVSETNMGAIKGHIRNLQPRGGTNFEAGYKGGTGLFKKVLDSNPEEYENRIIFLTDAMPNIGALSEDSLLGMTKSNADMKVHTTFIGVGVDFNTELIEAITKIRGANYYSVHSSKEFNTRMDDEFEFMVTLMVFNLLLKLDAPGFKIEKVYGSPEADEATGEIMKVNTLFPSKQVDGQTKGGIVILKLNKISDDASLKLSASYENRMGGIDQLTSSIQIPSVESDHYDNLGLRKGIALARYVNLMRNWIDDEREAYKAKKPVKASINYETGIMIPIDVPLQQLSRWERTSTPLSVSDDYVTLISDFKDHFDTEIEIIGDTTMTQESDIMQKLIS